MDWQPNSTASWLLRSIVNTRDDVSHLSYWQEVIHTGKYKTTKMYECLRGFKDTKIWRHILTRNLARPRATFIIWLVFSGRLNTKDRLLKLGTETDRRCVFCGDYESLEHLFFSCQSTGPIWKNILDWIGYDRQPGTWSEESKWLLQELRKKGWRRHLLKLVVTETVYTTWITRNAVCFGNETRMDMEQDIKHMIVHRGSLHRIVNTHIDKENMLIG
ncbi:uncharacterized protein LOC131641418 [Vicia villosa]|uniref:uncharacterized protein LOC131641418 n=1 Tax=Vicia villosa TaxID=3911 RepID=UPI00273CA2D4|nr:uncharacterized protein LOC131641418 [Vicia villosa]